MGESLKAEYDSDKTFKKLIKRDFKKRSNKKAKERKNNSLDLITKVYSIIGIIAIIYMATYIIVRATQKETEKNTSTCNPTKNLKKPKSQHNRTYPKHWQE